MTKSYQIPMTKQIVSIAVLATFALLPSALNADLKAEVSRLSPFASIPFQGELSTFEFLAPGVIAIASDTNPRLQWQRFKTVNKSRVEVNNTPGVLNILRIPNQDTVFAHFGYYSTLEARSIQTGNLKYRVDIGTPEYRSFGLAASASGEQIAVARDDTVLLCSTRRRRILRELTGFDSGLIDAVALSPDGHLAAGMTYAGESGDRELCIWNVDSGKRLYHINTDGEQPRANLGMGEPLFFLDNKSLICGLTYITRASGHFKARLALPVGAWHTLAQIPFLRNTLLCYRESDHAISEWDVLKNRRIGPIFRMNGVLIGERDMATTQWPVAISSDGTLALESTQKSSILMFHLPTAIFRK